MNATGPDTVRLLPPLTVSEGEIRDAKLDLEGAARSLKSSARPNAKPPSSPAATIAVPATIRIGRPLAPGRLAEREPVVLARYVAARTEHPLLR